MKELKRTLTREELHELVWSIPVKQLAEQYGISDRGLVKICERHLVPPPPRGYWAKIQAGHPAKKPKLRSVGNTALHTVHISAKVVTQRSTYLAEVLAAARQEFEREDQVLGTVASMKLPLTTHEPRPAPTPSKLHGDLKAFVAELRSLKPGRFGFVDLKYIKVAPTDIDRVENFIRRLASELEPDEFAFKAEQNRVGFSKDGTNVSFEITAPRKRLATRSKFGWEQYDYEHTGRCTMRIFGKTEGKTPQKWSDTDNRQIEKVIPQIAESFRVCFVVQKEEDEKQRLLEARRVHMAKRRELVLLRKKREEDRLSFIRWITDTRREADDLRATIASVPVSGELPLDYTRMISWARDRLVELEEQTAIERIQATLVERRLYSDPDHLFDPEGEPPPKQNYWDD